MDPRFFSCWQFVQAFRGERCINSHLGWISFVPEESMCAHIRTQKPQARDMQGTVKRKRVWCGGINGHYSLPRCIRFASHWLFKEPRLSLANPSQTATQQRALLYLKMSYVLSLLMQSLTNHIKFAGNSSHSSCRAKLLLPVWFC